MSTTTKEVPQPHIFKGSDIEQVCKEYYSFISTLLEDAADVGITLIVDPISVFHCNNLFFVIAFVCEDPFAEHTKAQRETQKKLSKIIDSTAGDLINPNCDHDYDENMKCTKCGKQIF